MKVIKGGNYKARYRNIEDDPKTCGYCSLSEYIVKEMDVQHMEKDVLNVMRETILQLFVK